MASNLPQDSGPGEGAPAPVYDEQSAANAIAGLLDIEDGAGDGGEESGVDETPDTGPDESQTPGDDGEGQSEPPDGDEPPATLAPPSSWTAQEKTLFSQLPPVAQQAILRRDSEQRAVVTRATQEIAEERRGWESERQAIVTQREQYAQSLNQVARLMLPEVQALENVDWARLAVEDKPRWIELTSQRENLRTRIAALQQEIARVNYQQQQDQQQARDRLMAAEKQKLVSKVPDLGDPEKGAKLSAALHENLTHYGFTPDEIGNVLDHRLFTVAVDAMKWRQEQAARASATTKKANPPPTLQRAGNAPATDARERRIANKVRNLGRTNSVQDAASLIEEMIA